MPARALSRLHALVLTAAVAPALTACGGGSDGYGRPAGDGSPLPVRSAEFAASSEVATQVGTILSANPTAKLGTVVVDGQGFTLYRFDEDTTKPPASNCAGECARRWPPVLATPGSPLTVQGVPQDVVGTINRPDGAVQLTLGGWPVYRYSGDTQPGATSGQGVGGNWAAVLPDGGKAEAGG